MNEQKDFCFTKWWLQMWHELRFWTFASVHEGRATKKSNVEAVSGLYANLNFGDDCSEESHCIGGSFVFTEERHWCKLCTVEKRASYVEQVDGRRLGQAALSISKGIPGFICGRIGVPKHMRASGHLAWPPHAVLKNMGISGGKHIHYTTKTNSALLLSS